MDSTLEYMYLVIFGIYLVFLWIHLGSLPTPAERPCRGTRCGRRRRPRTPPRSGIGPRTPPAKLDGLTMVYRIFFTCFLLFLQRRSCNDGFATKKYLPPL